MRWSRAVPAALALAGCVNDSQIAQVSSEIEVVPSLVDLGDVRVGTSVPVALSIAHSAGGEVTVAAVDVRNIDGSAFAYDGEVPLLVAPGALVPVEITYAPTETGWHRAEVTFVSDAAQASITVDVRAHAVQAEAYVYPRIVDFGPVRINDDEQAVVHVGNHGTVAFAITSATSSEAAFTVTDTLPIDVDPGAEITLHLEYVADTALAASADLDFVLDGASLPSVDLRANDCTNGTSDMYDSDGDGWTSCAGDCDDEAISVHPGAQEEENGDDDDCDGVTDDGTDAHDDDGDGSSESQGDCNDGLAAQAPDVVEIPANGIDDDCDGDVDQGSDDDDADGFAPLGGDCDDQAPLAFPGALERPDGKDNDCDGLVDEGTNTYDDDADGFSEVQGDCNDADPSMKPNGTESADRKDNDCDSRIDEGTIYGDDDGDGFSESAGDCDDTNPFRGPGRYDQPGNSVDEDCSPTTGP